MSLLRFLAVGLIFFVVACDRQPEASPDDVVTEVGVKMLQAQPVTLTSDLTGRVKDRLVSEVRPQQVDGIIQKRLFTEGDEVKEGQALYQIGPASYQASYDEALATIRALDPIHVDLTQSSSQLLQLRRQQASLKQGRHGTGDGHAGRRLALPAYR